MLYEPLVLTLVAFLWGATNPFIKANSKAIVKVKADTSIRQFILELKYLATNFKYLTPMVLNQLGSLIYFVTLQHTDLTLSVPLANSLTFVFTAVSGWILGEQFPKRETVLGIILILLGSSLCCVAKYNKVLV